MMSMALLNEIIDEFYYRWVLARNEKCVLHVEKQQIDIWQSHCLSICSSKSRCVASCWFYFPILFSRFQSDEERTPVSSIVEETFPLLLTIFCDIIQIKNPRRVYEADMQNILAWVYGKSAMRVVSCASLGRNYTCS